jgi:hypothetical protein
MERRPTTYFPFDGFHDFQEDVRLEVGFAGDCNIEKGRLIRDANRGRFIDRGHRKHTKVVPEKGDGVTKMCFAVTKIASQGEEYGT